MAELALLRRPGTSECAIWVVEAKSSTPRPKTQPRHDEFIEEIRQKLTNRLTLTIAACLGRHEDMSEDLPEPFRELDLSLTGFRLILVVADHPEEWCVPIQDALRQALKTTVKTWAIDPVAVAVINAEMAEERGLISGRDSSVDQRLTG